MLGIEALPVGRCGAIRRLIGIVVIIIVIAVVIQAVGIFGQLGLAALVDKLGVDKESNSGSAQNEGDDADDQDGGYPAAGAALVTENTAYCDVWKGIGIAGRIGSISGFAW